MINPALPRWQETHHWRSPLALVSSANVVAVLLGATQSIVVARALGPAGLGVLGIALAFGAVLVNFFDLRLLDVATKVFFQNHPEGSATVEPYRASVVRIGAFLQGCLAAITFAATFLATVALLPRFTSERLSLETILALSAVPAVASLSNYLGYMERFAGRVTIMVGAQVASSLIHAMTIIVAMILRPSLESYAFAAAAAGVAGCILHGAACVWLFPSPATWARHSPSGWALMRRFFSHRRLLVMNNLLGYSKLLHRAADVLLVGYFCNEYQTGLYKCARSVTDNISIANDVVLKTYQPTLFGMVAAQDHRGFKDMSRRMLAGAVVLTGIVMLGAIIALPSLVRLLYGPEFTGTVPAIMILTVPLVCVIGLNVWLWPLLVTFTSLGFYTVVSTLAVLVGQYLVGTTAFCFWGTESVIPFAVGHAMVFPLLYGPVLVFVKKALPRFSPL